MSQYLEILVAEFGEIDDSAWSEAERIAIDNYLQLLQTYPSRPIEGSVTIRNIGRGADWSVIALAIGGLFLAIPEAHKRLRESLEEWRRIFKEFQSISSWLGLVGKKSVLYPDQYLFLIATFHVVDRFEPDAIIFLNALRLPEDRPDLTQMGCLLFSFSLGNVVHQVAVDRGGRVLWENAISIPQIALGSDA
ncbi:hypothetical protein [Lysobacter sp. ESA13C]|uniref:hypothetical protein n=1 Tax=Lysobacter sp. ESA13C TaxID=2862676 RepID=UPI001CC16CD9|nr:hypothetical protein [Lysobacter sp. ESA13C]